MKAVISALAARSSGSSASRRASAASEARSCRRSARAMSASRMTSDRVFPCSVNCSSAARAVASRRTEIGCAAGDDIGSERSTESITG